MKPIDFTEWSQGKQKLWVGKGVCYGLSKKMGRELNKRDRNMNARKVFDLADRLLSGLGLLQSGISKQKGESQWGNVSASPPFKHGCAIIISCNISSGAGWCCGKFSWSSYIAPWRWWGDHACLIWVADDGLFVFDPNVGISLWDVRPQDVTWTMITLTLDWGYRKIHSSRPVYVTSAEFVNRGDA